MTAERLLEWFASRARELPWRVEPRDPYRVLVSEVMLQQTQVDRVTARFEAFVRRFPDVETLAAATVQEVLEAWSGLGYYRRARALHAAARAVAARGSWPPSASELGKLPGVGPYTAAAVASLAFGEAVPVLDGNVIRVGARVLALDVPARRAEGRRRIASWVAELMVGAPPGEVNEALMELGATVCAPSSPACHGCPLAETCAGLASGDPERWPEPRPVRAPERLLWAAALIWDDQGSILVRRVEKGTILRGLWLPPMGSIETPAAAAATAAELAPVPVEPLPGTKPAPVRHSITHRRIEVHPVVLAALDQDVPPGWRWVDPAEPGLPTSSLFGKLLRSLDAAGFSPPPSLPEEPRGPGNPPRSRW